MFHLSEYSCFTSVHQHKLSPQHQNQIHFHSTKGLIVLFSRFSSSSPLTIFLLEWIAAPTFKFCIYDGLTISQLWFRPRSSHSAIQRCRKFHKSMKGCRDSTGVIAAAGNIYKWILWVITQSHPLIHFSGIGTSIPCFCKVPST